MPLIAAKMMRTPLQTDRIMIHFDSMDDENTVANRADADRVLIA